MNRCEGCGVEIADEMASVVLTPDVLFIGTNDYPLTDPLDAEDWKKEWCNVDCFALWMMFAFGALS